MIQILGMKLNIKRFKNIIRKLKETDIDSYDYCLWLVMARMLGRNIALERTVFLPCEIATMNMVKRFLPKE